MQTWFPLSNKLFADWYASQRTQTSLRRLQDVFKRSRHHTTEPDVATTSCRRRLIWDVLKMSDLVDLKNSDLQRLKDAWFTLSCRRLIYDVLKKPDLRRLEEVRFTTSWRRLIYDVLKTSSLRRLEDVWFTSSW